MDKVKKKRRSRWKRYTIPEDIKSQLSDQALSSIERVQLAEKCRKQYSYNREDMLALTDIGNTQYARYQWVLRYGDERLFNLLRQRECSVSMAIKDIQEPGYLDKRERYCLRDKLEREYGEVEMIYERYKYALYRIKPNDGCYLAVSYIVKGNDDDLIWCREQNTCCIDDNKAIIDTIVELLQQGCTISKAFRVTTPDRRSVALYYYVVSVFSGTPLDEVIRSATKPKHKPWNGAYDMRLSSLWVPGELAIQYADVIGSNTIVRRGDSITIINRKNGSVNYTDYSPWLFKFLKEHGDNISLQARDRRLCLPVGNRVEYLHHIILAVELYGEPSEAEPLSKKIQRFRNAYFDLGYEVDHLDGDAQNNRVSNLMLMTCSGHAKKSGLCKRMENFNQKLRKPYEWSIVKAPHKKISPCVCKLERYDNKSVRMQVGIMQGTSQNAEYTVQGVFTVPEMLYQLETFLHDVEQNEAIFAEFSRLENEEEYKCYKLGLT